MFTGSCQPRGRMAGSHIVGSEFRVLVLAPTTCSELSGLPLLWASSYLTCAGSEQTLLCMLSMRKSDSQYI